MELATGPLGEQLPLKAGVKGRAGSRARASGPQKSTDSLQHCQEN
jgi:hypothetical protein